MHKQCFVAETKGSKGIRVFPDPCLVETAKVESRIVTFEGHSDLVNISTF